MDLALHPHGPVGVFHLPRLGWIDRRGTVSMAEIIRRERRNDLYRVTGSGV